MVKQQLKRGWRKPSKSGTNGNCVELASGNRTVLVRDSKSLDGLVIPFPASAWERFAESLR